MRNLGAGLCEGRGRYQMKTGESPGPSLGFSMPAATKFCGLLQTREEMSLFAGTMLGHVMGM